MSLVSHTISLVRMTDSHLFRTYCWLHDSAELRRQVDCLKIPTEEGNRAYWQVMWQDSRRKDYAILTSSDGRHIGNCGLCEIDTVRRKAQLWIYLGESYGNHSGTCAAEQLLAYAFKVLNLERVFLRVLSNNHRALRFYRKIGFVEEGVSRHDTIADGQSLDAVFMSMLQTEYLSRTGGGASC